jgi:protein O-GlcNAc transferase
MDEPISLDAMLVYAAGERDAGRLESAEAAFRQMLVMAPDHPAVSFGYARLLQKAGRSSEAIDQARRALVSAPGQPVLHYNFGLLLRECGDEATALKAFTEACRLNPNFAESWNNRALSHEAAGRKVEAMADYRQALAVRPNYPTALSNLGGLLLESNDLPAALECFYALLALDKANVSARVKTASTLARLDRHEEAKQLLVGVNEPAALKELARLCEATNDAAGARQCYRAITTLSPQDLRAQIDARLVLPAVYPTVEAIHLARSEFTQGLEDLLPLLPGIDTTAEQRLRAADRSNFYLAYQGEDDLKLQQSYGRLLEHLLDGVLPQYKGPVLNTERHRHRIGFASCFLRDCTVGHYFKSWITDLAAEGFDIHLYNLGAPSDSFTDELAAISHRYQLLAAPLSETAAAILADDLDVLIYPELGMNGRTLALAATRLAPIQCAAWGHPVTTGLRSIDYYLSSDLMETQDAQTHYIETLVRLPGLGTRYSRPPVASSMKRSDFGLAESAHLYFYPHAPFKVHPEDDALAAAILAQDTQGLLIACAGPRRHATQAYVQRLRGSLARQAVDPERLIVLPHLPRTQFLELARLCDLMLDTGRWSGGQSSLDAIAAGLPIVTRPGKLMRSRQTAGMLTRLNVPELIASDDSRYVDIALRLARDREWRKELSARIDANAALLFDDREPTAALARFLESRITAI